jgi:hypothetical protein
LTTYFYVLVALITSARPLSGIPLLLLDGSVSESTTWSMVVHRFTELFQDFVVQMEAEEGIKEVGFLVLK